MTENKSNPPTSVETTLNETRLESWKEIATYLGRDVSTARRWEKQEQLPVHRYLHQARSSVYAYPSELDAWKIEREPRLNAPILVTPWRRATAAVGFALTVLLSLVTLASGPILSPAIASAQGIVNRQVWAGPKTDFYGAVSPDGKYLSFVDWGTGDLAIRDIEKETSRPLTNKGSWEASDAEAERSIWSPDGKQVAYQWFRWDTEPARYELRVISLDNPTPRVLHRSAGPYETIRPFDWSPDGRHILGVLFKEDASEQVVLLSVADGAVRVLKTLSQNVGLTHAAISPDGQYVVYDYPQSDSSLAHDIFLLPIAGGSETRLVKYPADDLVLGWAPDGNRVLFTSDRRGSVDVWAIRLEDGKPQGAPLMVKSGVGRIHPLGITRSGSFYYGVGGNRSNVYVVKLDPATGNVLVPPQKLVKRFEGSNHGPAYSPDGNYLAYVSKRIEGLASAGTGWGDTLCVRSLETGEEREYQREMIRAGARGFSRPSWSPDGRSVLLFGRDSGGRYGIFHINLKTGKALNVLRQGEDLFVAPAGWRDERNFLYGRVDEKNNRGEIRLRNLDSGDEKVLYSVSPAVNGALAVSPDRRWLSALESSRSREYVLRVISTDSGEVKRLFKFSQKDRPDRIRHAWSADSKYVFYIKRSVTKDSSKFEVWRMPVDGGQPQKTGLEMPGVIDYMSAHPDGEHIAFENMAPMSASPAEVWAMENFLPTLKASM
jgi:Tol biopolymer transport system component